MTYPFCIRKRVTKLKFQWSKVASVLGSYQDFIKSYHLSISAAGFSNEQIEAQLNTINRRFEQLKATVTGIATGMGASGLSAYIKNILVSLNSFAQALQRIPTSAYEMIGAIVKWGAALGGALFILRRVVAGIVGMQAAYRTFAAAQALETVTTEASTGAKIRNTLARVAGVNAARSQFAASTMATGGIIAETAATEAATVATTGWATAMTAATAGLNLVLAAIAAATVAFLGYNTTVSDSIEKQEGLKQSSEDLIAIEQQKLDMTKKEADFVETLIRAHFKLAEQVDNTSNSEEKNAQIKRDLQVTDQKLAEMIGEDGLKRIKSSKDVQTAVDTEKAKYKAKAESCVKNMIESAKAEREYTRQALQAAVDRVDALKSETQAWGAWARAKQAAMNVYAGLAEGQIKSATYQMSIHEAGSPEYDRAAQQLKVWQNERDWASNWKPGEVTGELAQLNQTIAELNGKLAQQDLNIAGMELNLAKIQQGNGLDTLPTDEIDSGEVPDEPDKSKKKKGSKGRTAKKADNSAEAMGYRYLTGKGLDKNMVLGILANIAHESSFNPDATNGDHWGMIQWDSDRWGRFLGEYLSMRGMSQSDYYASDVNTKRTLQYDYIVHEMTKGAERGSYQKILDAVPSTPEQWAHLINMHYERSGVYSGGTDWERQKSAREYATRFERKNGEDNYTDGEKAIENAYKQAKKLFDLELQKLKYEREMKGEKVTALDEKALYEKIMFVNGKNPYALLEQAQKDYQKVLLDVAKYEATRQEAIQKATETQVKAIEKMADAEVAFAEKLGIMSKQDVWKYNYQKNEKNYATKKPFLDAELGATVDMSRGTAEDILAEYQAIIDAQNEAEARLHAQKLMYLSRDVDATKKALDEELKLEEKYQQERYKLEQEAFQYKNRYVIGFKDAFVSEWQSGLESILNRTKSFGEAMRDMLKNLVNSMIKLFTEDWASRLNKVLSNALFPQKETGFALGTRHSRGATASPAQMASQYTAANLGSWASNSLPLMGGGKKNKNGLIDNMLPQSAVNVAKTRMNQVKQVTTQGVTSMKVAAETASAQSLATETANDVAKTTAHTTMETTKTAVTTTAEGTRVATSNAAQATVMANLQAMMVQMLAAMAIMAVFGAIFGGGGSKTSTSTSEVNLGRSPDSYYMTPSAVMQSTTFQVPSFDIGGNIEQDMFAMVHKGEMVLTPEQAEVIRSSARTGGSMGNGSANANVKSSINVTTVSSRGFEQVLRDYNRDLSKNVKKGIRNGYLTAKGLV